MSSKIKIFLVSILLINSSLDIFAQKKYMTAADSDKDAIVILNKTKGILNNAKSLFFDFSFTTRIPDETPSILNGIAKQKGDMYFLDMGNQSIYCDGKKISVYLKTQNEIQLNDIDEDSGMLTPSDLLNTFNSENYIYVLGQNSNENKNTYYKIIFKPIDKYSEYSKIETLINKKTLLPYKIKMFYKDGTRTILKINSVKMNQKIENNVFIFNKTEHPGVSVEDLRMN